MAAVSGFAGIVSRSWRLPDGCNVEIQHNTILGGFDVFVDGEKVPGGNGTLSIFGSSAEIVVQSTACKATVHIEREGGRVRYTCCTGGKEVQELSEALATAGAEEFAQTSIVAAYVGLDAGGSKAAWYQVKSTAPNGGGVLSSVHRRFNEFASLREAVLASLSGSQLASQVPPLPSKQSMFVNHFSAEFLQARMGKFQHQLRKAAVALTRTQSQARWRCF